MTNLDTQENTNNPSEAPRNPELKDEVVQAFMNAGFKEVPTELGGITLYSPIDHHTHHVVTIMPEQNAESGWAINIKDGTHHIRRGKIGNLLAKITGEKDENPQDILERSGFRLGKIPPNHELNEGRSITYCIESLE